ncbi:bifunctional folylpolyglutamate synthase/dihydrofolate synthase [Vallitalea guaymasensis]|uniref:tetrahydrofolate synthase n=1 Tax=Vallitalea guaymasensis TaxID=1185412 RepID=A0A8J8M925_9FIRM|nr:folylpolyglutamate synthase/dihydrofolate synthase family protein [Vallitalea guaymasensis]QUH28370.1 bifunctional folylpolyglutamate synthase/dihydrofolate synthase [Vallitalea guaymasensis]
MNYNKAVKYILDIPKFGVKSGLDNIKTLLKLLDNPQNNLKFIHVAGTNGKGSVCTMLSYILCEHGYKTGLFTSPHLVEINERIKINNTNISNDDLTNILILIKEKIDYMVDNGFNHPTFFEVLVAIALVYYKNKNVDYVILETGLGGRLDSTNVIENPILTIITSIGLDHVAILGNTIEEIAKEKAGIIKQGRPTVLYYDKKEIFDTINVECVNKKSKLYSYNDFHYSILKRTKKNIDFSINNKYYNYEEVFLNTIANYQIINVSIALTAVEVLIDEGMNLNTESILKGLKKFKWPGRMEYVMDNMLIDGAHNAQGISMFVNNINNLYDNTEINILYASLKDKPYNEMISELKKCNNINRMILTQIDSDRATDVNLLKESCEKLGYDNICPIANIHDAVDYAMQLSREGRMVCCIGSLYLVGYIKSKIKEEDQYD